VSAKADLEDLRGPRKSMRNLAARSPPKFTGMRKATWPTTRIPRSRARQPGVRHFAQMDASSLPPLGLRLAVRPLSRPPPTAQGALTRRPTRLDLRDGSTSIYALNQLSELKGLRDNRCL